MRNYRDFPIVLAASLGEDSQTNMTTKTSSRSIFFFLALLTPLFSLLAATETYVADPAHSSVQFGVRHFFSKVPGSFGKFEATVVVDRENMEKSTIKASIDVDSVNTNQEKRDAHLKTADFFDAPKFPKMTFASTAWKKTGENEYDVTGDLSLHGVTKPVTLKVKSLGFGPGMKGVQLSGWEAKGSIKRSEFGMTGGAPAVGDDVEIEINIEAKKQ
jgi:polyisoprenoid-binding protein YceI